MGGIERASYVIIHIYQIDTREPAERARFVCARSLREIQNRRAGGGAVQENRTRDGLAGGGGGIL